MSFALGSKTLRPTTASAKETYDRLRKTEGALRQSIDENGVLVLDSSESIQYAQDFKKFAELLTNDMRWNDAAASRRTKLQAISGTNDDVVNMRQLAVGIEIRQTMMPIVTALKEARGIKEYPFNGTEPQGIKLTEISYPALEDAFYFGDLRGLQAKGHFKNTDIATILEVTSLQDLVNAHQAMCDIAVVKLILEKDLGPGQQDVDRKFLSRVTDFISEQAKVNYRHALSSLAESRRPTRDFDEIQARAEAYVAQDKAPNGLDARNRLSHASGGVEAVAPK